MRALLDTNVVLDALLERVPFSIEARLLLEANRLGHFEAYICAITPINLFYIGRKVKGTSAARYDIQLIMTELQICPINQAVLETALNLPFTDYEDAVQHASAVASGMQAIITRNLKDYTGATLPVYTPVDFLTQIAHPG